MPWAGCWVSGQRVPRGLACVLSPVPGKPRCGPFSSLLPPGVHRMKPTFPQRKGKRTVENMKTLSQMSLSCESPRPSSVATLLSLPILFQSPYPWVTG